MALDDMTEVYPGLRIAITSTATHGQTLFDNYFIPYMQKVSTDMSFAYQPKSMQIGVEGCESVNRGNASAHILSFIASTFQDLFDNRCVPSCMHGLMDNLAFSHKKRSKQIETHSYESLFRGCAPTFHAAPGLLFAIIASELNSEIYTQWKIREIKEAIAFSIYIRKPVSVNFTLTDTANTSMLQAINSMDLKASVKAHIDIELLETSTWKVADVQPLRMLFREIHYDDAKLTTLELAADLCKAGCLDAIKLDLLMLVQAFRVSVFFAPGEENVFFKTKIPDIEKSAEMKQQLMKKIGLLMNEHTNIKIIFEASIPFDDIKSAFEENGFDGALVGRCLVQGAATGAQAFVKKQI